MDNKENEKLPFEKALFLALSDHDLLLPVNDDQVKNFEKEIGETSNLPEIFLNPITFLPNDDNLRTLNPDTDFDLYNLKVASSEDPDTPED